MIQRECVREPDLLDAIVSGRWPERCDEELRQHVSSCAICSDVAVAAPALRADYADAWQQVQPPPAGLVWWRAEMRARQEAMRVASRPITIVEAIAGAVAFIVCIALAGKVGVGAISSLAMEYAVPLAVALGFLFVVTPVALYFVFSGERN